jgi:hypothetical protein
MRVCRKLAFLRFVIRPNYKIEWKKAENSFCSDDKNLCFVFETRDRAFHTDL